MGKHPKLLPQARKKASLQKTWWKAISFEPCAFTFEQPKNILRVARSFLRCGHSKHFRMSRAKTTELMKFDSNRITQRMTTKKEFRSALRDKKIGQEVAEIMLAAFPKEMEDEREALASKQKAVYKIKKTQLALLREPFLGQWIFKMRKCCGFGWEWSNVTVKILSVTPTSVVIQEEISREECRLTLNKYPQLNTIAENHCRSNIWRMIQRDHCKRLIEVTKILNKSFTSTDLQAIIREYI